MSHPDEELRRRLSRSFSPSLAVIDEPLAVTTVDGCRILETNEAFSRLTGLAPEELVGRELPALRLVPDATLDDVLSRDLDSGLARDVEASLRTASEETRAVRISVARCEDRDASWLVWSLRVAEPTDSGTEKGAHEGRLETVRDFGAVRSPDEPRPRLIQIGAELIREVIC